MTYVIGYVKNGKFIVLHKSNNVRLALFRYKKYQDKNADIVIKKLDSNSHL